MTAWKVTGFVATLLIVASIPLYLIRTRWLAPWPDGAGVRPQATFVGREKCRPCHEKEYALWLNSDHDRAMAEADETSVLGDFNDRVFVHAGVTSRFYRQGKDFYVRTAGSGGEIQDVRIAYTFGHFPLQQYLVAFAGGRLQALPLAWDVAAQRWFHLNPTEKLDPADWLYWTNQSHNWNGMCAECHSTQVKKNYDPGTRTYQTSWAEIDVSCEACHGPGSRHLAWAELPESERPQADQADLTVKTAELTTEEQIGLCARCHSRRIQLEDYRHDRKHLLDSIVPELLVEGRYFADGQIQDEVFVYGSFLQSKMYQKGVKCSDCHDVHSLKPIMEGNRLCLQCHRGEIYDTADHHFHRQAGQPGQPLKDPAGRVISAVGQGAECVHCHLPGRFYMEVDYRRDHSLRIPRPDLSLALGTPNACTQCHQGQSDGWADEWLTRWYGLSRKAHYGTALAAGRQGNPEAGPALVRLAEDPLLPPIVRATALTLLNAASADGTRALSRALEDPEDLIRQTAAGCFHPADPVEHINHLAPLLTDPVRAVRQEAALNLASISQIQMSERQRAAFEKALTEYRQAMAYLADFPFAALNLGNLECFRGRFDQAEAHYREAIRLADDFSPAKVNLALLLNRQGKNEEAEKRLREVLAQEPEAHETWYRLGLLLAEEHRDQDAVAALETAANGLSRRARLWYNLGLLRQRLNRPDAEKALQHALHLEADNADFRYALAYYYFQQGEMKKAEAVARQQAHAGDTPSHLKFRQLLQQIERTGKTP